MINDGYARVLVIGQAGFLIQVNMLPTDFYFILSVELFSFGNTHMPLWGGFESRSPHTQSNGVRVYEFTYQCA